jgi:preprotein translocase subunit YajC
LSGGAIAGIVIGVIVGVVLIVGLIYFFMSRSEKTVGTGHKDGLLDDISPGQNIRGSAAQRPL